ncbi:MAG: hypothetical protein M0Z56_05275 [Desulfobacteraceae bacterium]|nr:hypothetical protein [Desulfobacteraceae bacterium]
MKFFIRRIAVLFFLILSAALLFACSKPKEGKVIISESGFSMRKDTGRSWVINAKGKIKNVGGVDVKNVVVTGYCRSCGEVVMSGTWFISDIEKADDQKDIISYLPAGAEKEFSFKNVAFGWYGTKPDKMPDRLECVILSFEPVEK